MRWIVGICLLLFCGAEACEIDISSQWIADDSDGTLERLVENELKDCPRESVKTLYISGNPISKIYNVDMFANMSKLERLYLDGNKITHFQPGLFDGLASLEQLYLGGNRLKSLEPNVFQGLSSLKVLRLNYNQLESLDPQALAGLSSLTTLRLEGNDLPGLLPSIWETLGALKEVAVDTPPACDTIGTDFCHAKPPHIAVSNPLRGSVHQGIRRPPTLSPTTSPTAAPSSAPSKAPSAAPVRSPVLPDSIQGVNQDTLDTVAGSIEDLNLTGGASYSDATVSSGTISEARLPALALFVFTCVLHSAYH